MESWRERDQSHMPWFAKNELLELVSLDLGTAGNCLVVARATQEWFHYAKGFVGLLSLLEQQRPDARESRERSRVCGSENIFPTKPGGCLQPGEPGYMAGANHRLGGDRENNKIARWFLFAESVDVLSKTTDAKFRHLVPLMLRTEDIPEIC